MKASLLTIIIVLVLVGIPKSAAQGLTEDPIQGNITGGPPPPPPPQRRSLEPNPPVTVILTYDHIPTANDLSGLEGLGLSYHTYNKLPMVTVTGPDAVVQKCESLEGVMSIWFNRAVEFHGNLSREVIGADTVTGALGITGRGVGVAIVDTGIDATHPDLQFGSVVRENIKFAYGAASSAQSTETLSGHGTYCAGIVAGRGTASRGKYRGIAPGATIVGLSIGTAGSIATVLEAYNWVLNHHNDYNIKIVSNSWGTTGEYSLVDPVNVATKAMAVAGISVVFSVGNNGPELNTINPYSVAPWVIGVAAAIDGGTTLAPFSSKGTSDDGTRHPTVTAPGVYVTSCTSTNGLLGNMLGDPYDVAHCPVPDMPSYTCNSGTSVAAPHVSGTLALMLEANPNLTPSQLKDIIVRSAVSMPSYQQHEVGAGFLNAWSAVQLALQS